MVNVSWRCSNIPLPPKRRKPHDRYFPFSNFFKYQIKNYPLRKPQSVLIHILTWQSVKIPNFQILKREIKKNIFALAEIVNLLNYTLLPRYLRISYFKFFYFSFLNGFKLRKRYILFRISKRTEKVYILAGFNVSNILLNSFK